MAHVHSQLSEAMGSTLRADPIGARLSVAGCEAQPIKAIRAITLACAAQSRPVRFLELKRNYPRIFEVFGLTIEWIGALLLLLHLTGFFTFQERIEFYERLVSERKDIPIELTIAKEAAINFGITKEQLPELGFVGYKWISIGDAKPFGGYFYVREKNGERIKTISTINELKDWAYENSSIYLWLSVALLFAGIIIKTIAIIFTKKPNNLMSLGF